MVIQRELELWTVNSTKSKNDSDSDEGDADHLVHIYFQFNDFVFIWKYLPKAQM